MLYLVEDKTRDVTLRQELIGANAAKDQFLALLSHELRNPLSPVIAMVGELEASAPDSPEVRRALEVIRRNVELEARLIDDLLDVTRISKGKLQLSLETVSVHEILQRSYEICREEIAAKDLRIEFRLRAEHTYVEGDPARLQQVFWNLIKNSVKFTPEKGRIVIETFNPSPDAIEIRTTDTGIGIEAERCRQIFNAFEQGQSSITRRFGGLGLGLAISKAMVAAHGGKIKAESHGKDRGATFIVTLETVATPARRFQRRGQETVASARPAKEARATRPERRVLVVDDHYDTCTGMKMMLERRGYRVTVAHTADQAVEKDPSRRIRSCHQRHRLAGSIRLRADAGIERHQRAARNRPERVRHGKRRQPRPGRRILRTPDQADQLRSPGRVDPESAGTGAGRRLVIRREAYGRRVPRPLSRSAACFSDGFLQFARKFFHPLAHDFPRLELDGRARRNNKTAARLIRVAPHAGLGQARLKNAKIPQFDRDIIGQTVGNVVESSLHNVKDLVLHHPSLIADGHNNVPFCKLRHITN